MSKRAIILKGGTIHSAILAAAVKVPCGYHRVYLYLYRVLCFYLGCIRKRITLYFHDKQFLRSGRSDRSKRDSLSFFSPFHRCQLFNEVHTF